MAAKRDPAADTVQRLIRRIERYIVQDNPVASPLRSFHVAENSGTGQSGLNKV